MIEIIPAIDMIDGQCVRLSRGDFHTSKVYASDPLAVAQQFEAAGLKRLHLVNLDGARTGDSKALQVLELIAKHTSLIIDYSGGLRSETAVRQAFSAGAHIAGIGSFAVQNPGTFLDWLQLFGPDKLLLGADVRNGKLAIHGWAEQTDISLLPFLQPMCDAGLRQLFCTDIDTDGMLAGCAIPLYEQIRTKYPQLNLIASGGVSGVHDIEALENVGCTGVIIGKAIYEGHISLSQLKRFIA